MQSLSAQGMRVADAREFENQAVTLDDIGDADAVHFPEIGVALVGGDAAQQRSLSAQSDIASDNPIESIDPEYYVFAYGASEGSVSEYLRGFLQATETIARDLRGAGQAEVDLEEETLVLGATWGITACKVPQSLCSGVGIKVALLDSGMDMGHSDFVGHLIPGQPQSFVGQPVQDQYGHATHCIGTSCGPKAPVGSTPRYGIAYRASIFAGKVLSNSGSSVGGSVLNGMNWAIANRCQVISMSLGSQ